MEGVKHGIIGYKICILYKLLDYRVSAVLYVDNIAHIHFRSYIFVAACHRSKAHINVKLCKQCGCFPYSFGLSCYLVSYIAENIVFKRAHLICGTEYGRFHILKLIGDVSFAIDKRLLSDISVRDKIYK